MEREERRGRRDRLSWGHQNSRKQEEEEWMRGENRPGSRRNVRRVVDVCLRERQRRRLIRVRLRFVCTKKVSEKE